MSPSQNEAEERTTIRLLAESIISALPSFLHEHKFLIKRIFRTKNNKFILLCTNGFLIDRNLSIDITENPLKSEPIDITENENDSQLPLRLLQTLDQSVKHYANTIKSEQLALKAPLAKEAPKKLTISTVIEKESDEIVTASSELNNIKKEILEMTESRIRTLNRLVLQLSQAKNRIINEAVEEAKNELETDENKKKLQDFANQTSTQLNPTKIEKDILALHRKIQEIAPIPNKFIAETDTYFSKVNTQINTLTEFKKIIIDAVYLAAKERYLSLMPKLKEKTSHDKINVRADFNKKFAPFAEIDINNNLISLELIESKLSSLSLETIQELISNDDKENLGVIGRCNTSWTEESEELKILMKQLREIDSLLIALFEKNKEFKDYSTQKMVEIIRTPFPRSYQFKFTERALQFKNSIEEYEKIQKEKMLQAAKSYKRIMQIDEIEQNAKNAIIALETEIENLKTPVLTFAKALKRNEKTEKILQETAESEKTLTNMLNLSNELHSLLHSINDESFSPIKQKIALYDKDIERSLKLVKQTINNMNDLNNKINKDLKLKSVTENTIVEMDRSIDALKKQHLALKKYMAPIHEAHSKFQNYTQAFLLFAKITDVVKQSNVRKEQAEAKNFLLEAIKKQNGMESEILKNNMITLYTNMDNNVAKLDQINAQLLEIKKNLLEKIEEEEISMEKFNQLVSQIQLKLDEERHIKHEINNTIKMMEASK